MSHLGNGFRLLTLRRFSTTDNVSPLQVRETTDEYSLQRLDDTEIRGPALILDDAFGALSRAPAGHEPYSIGDSYISELATRENLHLDGTDGLSVKLFDSTADCPQQPGVVLIKVPRTLALLEQQLRALCEVVTPDTCIITGAKVRDIRTSTLKLFEKMLGPTTITLVWKKARLINCTFNEPPLVDASQTVSWKPKGTDWVIHNHTNIFSRTGLDIGTHFFMQHLPENLEGETVNLGCGNGVTGLTLLDKNPQVKVVFVDESPMVVTSSRMNVETSMPETSDHCEFMVNNAFSGAKSFRSSAVLCNLPFHQQHALTGNAAWEMLHHARRYLEVNGELYTVANRHLDYFHKLKKISGNCTIVAMNNKFMVLKTVKLGRRR